MKTWFTSDTHFGHSNIIKYCNRPFGNVDIMNRVLTENWNSRINPHDFVIFLGDFCFRGQSKAEEYLSNLNGHITFIKGNHDKNNSLNTNIVYLVIEMNNQDIFCTHYPKNYSNSYLINLVGHVHEKWKIKKIYNSYLINVGVDIWNYASVDINEILKALTEYKKDKKGKKNV